MIVEQFEKKKNVERLFAKRSRLKKTVWKKTKTLIKIMFGNRSKTV